MRHHEQTKKKGLDPKRALYSLRMSGEGSLEASSTGVGAMRSSQPTGQHSTGATAANQAAEHNATA